MVQSRLLARLRPKAIVCSASDPMGNRNMPYIQLTLGSQRTQSYTIRRRQRHRWLRCMIQVGMNRTAEVDVTSSCISAAISMS